MCFMWLMRVSIWADSVALRNYFIGETFYCFYSECFQTIDCFGFYDACISYLYSSFCQTQLVTFSSILILLLFYRPGQISSGMLSCGFSSISMIYLFLLSTLKTTLSSSISSYCCLLILNYLSSAIFYRTFSALSLSSCCLFLSSSFLLCSSCSSLRFFSSSSLATTSLTMPSALTLIVSSYSTRGFLQNLGLPLAQTDLFTCLSFMGKGSAQIDPKNDSLSCSNVDQHIIESFSQGLWQIRIEQQLDVSQNVKGHWNYAEMVPWWVGDHCSCWPTRTNTTIFWVSGLWVQ